VAIVVTRRCPQFVRDAVRGMPVLNVDGRLTNPLGRIDLAVGVIGTMLHPQNKTARLRRRCALAVTCLAKSDEDDEPEALSLVNSWFSRSGGFKTASRSDPYEKQQGAFLKQLPQILAAGLALHLVWAMDLHHRTQLTGGASLNKAIAIMLRYPVWPDSLSERSIRSAWSRRKSVAPLCAAFALVFDEAHRTPSGEVEECHKIEERLKIAYDDDLPLTLALAAAYERFGSSFRSHGNDRPLLDPNKIWRLRGVEANETFVPPPLPSEMLAVAQEYDAPLNAAYRSH
jgi:hypothetical protein